jgi:twitching motility protein PilJ
MKQRMMTFNTRTSAKMSSRLLMALVVTALALLVVNLVFVNIHSTEDQIYIQRTADMRVLLQEIPQRVSQAVAGSDLGYDKLESTVMDFGSAWNLIRYGDPLYVDSGLGFKTGLPARDGEISKMFPTAADLWIQIGANVTYIQTNRADLQRVSNIAATASDNIPLIQRSYNEIVNTLLDSNASITSIAAAQRQTWLSERIALNLDRIASGGGETRAALEQFQQDVILFSSNHEALLKGDVSIGINRVDNGAAREALTKVSELFAEIENQARVIIETAPQIRKAAEAADAISNDAELLQVEVAKLYQLFTKTRGQHLASPVMGYGLLIGILFLMCLYGIAVIRQSRIAEKRAGEESQKKNQAVLNLLEEISDLAKGDLTVQATVSEDFTGAIADSINYAVGQLRELVSAIIDVSVQVTEATKSSESTARHLSDASGRQTSNIMSVTESVRAMEKKINHVTDNAMQSLEVAKNSVLIAAGGADVVKSTIQGMNTIREQIHETSKRIKRLGESSQEIGGFVSLINNIADHTNTLSLNAAIQAAMAGDAGKGFGVVADEVHALAERSTDATRQIESLVRMIQRDINEAVTSMELTTAEVVNGTQLAQDAGASLDGIQKVSRELAALVEEITEAARSQSHTASQITGSMEIIQQITTETSSGTETTSEFIFNLGKLTDRLHKAVAGFSLPSAKKSAVGYRTPANDAGHAKQRGESADETVVYPKVSLDRNHTVGGAVSA